MDARRVGLGEEVGMKYYIKLMNSRTGKTVVMSSPTFTSLREAEEYGERFVRLLANTSFEVVTRK